MSRLSDKTVKKDCVYFKQKNPARVTNNDCELCTELICSKKKCTLYKVKED